MAGEISRDTSELFEFGPFVLDSVKRLLLRDGERVRLAPKAFDILLTLVRLRDRVVTKDELLSTIWPAVTVEEGNLAVNICEIRKALGDADRHSFIVTIPGQGYRFVGAIKVDECAPPALSIRTTGLTSPPERFRSMVVVPFTMLGSDCPESIGIGLVNSLVSRLSRYWQMARPIHAATAYRRDTDTLTLAHHLEVDAAISGVIRRVDNRIRLFVEVIRARDGMIVWAETFDELFTDLLVAEDSVAARIVSALASCLYVGQADRFATKTVNPDAHQAYLRGRYCWNKRTEEGCLKAIHYFKLALERDPSYSVAHAGLADCYIFLGIYSAAVPSDTHLRVTEAAQQALALDSNLAEAHASLAYSKLLFQWDFIGADSDFRRALTLNPTYSSGHAWRSDYFLATGRFNEALVAMKLAESLEPLSLMISANIGEILLYSRRYDEARAHLAGTIALEERFATSHYLLGLAQLQVGEHAEAISELQTAVKLSGGSPIILGALGHAYGVSGQRLKAHGVVAELRQMGRTRYVSPYVLAMVYSGLRDAEHSIEALESAFRERSAWLIYINIDPRFEWMRNDSRFVDLLKRIGSATIAPNAY